jgi:hypothetical protein
MEIQTIHDSMNEMKANCSVHEGSPLNLLRLSPLRYDLHSCASRFLCSALFGFAQDLLILCLYGAAVLIGFKPGIMGLLYTLIEVPIIWGILGIFFYSEMLDLAGDIAEKAPALTRWHRLTLGKKLFHS